MTIFFAAAFVVFCIGALSVELTTRMPEARRGVWFILDPVWRYRLLLALFLMLALAVFIDAWRPEADVGFATVLAGPAGARAMAGALAGAVLLLGVAGTRFLRPTSLKDVAGLTVALIIPVAIFVVAAFLSDPASRGVLRSLEIGGLAKVELAGAATRNDPARQETQRSLIHPGSENGDRRPQLRAMQDYVRVDGEAERTDRHNAFQRDSEFLAHFGGDAALAGGERAWRAQKEFLGRFSPLLSCLDSYIERSRDRPLIAVTLARPLLQLAMIERGWRSLELKTDRQEVAIDADRDRLKEGLTSLARLLEEPVTLMQGYIVAAGETGEVCESDKVIAPIRQTWTPPLPSGNIPPYVALFSAWSFSSVGSYELAVQTLADWVDDYRKVNKQQQEDPVRSWFELRALMELAAISLIHEKNASESRLSRRLLGEALGALSRMDKIPDLALYGRQRNPRCGASPPGKIVQRLIWLQASLLDRFLHAVIDNEDKERDLRRTDLDAAEALGNLDPDCIRAVPEVKATRRQAYAASYRGTYARVLWAWAARAEQAQGLTSTALQDTREEARKHARVAWYSILAAEAAWLNENERRCVTTSCSWGDLLARDVDFAAERNRIKSLCLEIASQPE